VGGGVAGAHPRRRLGVVPRRAKVEEPETPREDEKKQEE
jgi:hypothetical protein